ncbi:MAG: tetraacyldisaccharide 4'-kinase [Comamonadaceae bacterium PBBC2]|nr:MAG: tetraacyldisaccharide 4'-kinase [Comamonadaceae bacterium PBBC2]
MQQRLRQSWNHRGLLPRLLLPVAAFYGALAALRRQLYRWQWQKSRRVSVPVAVVGNVVAGGSGKTPVTIALVEHLKATGWLVGVVSRGYGRSSIGCLEVTAATPPHEAGDEPLLIQQKTGVPVFVGPGRFEAASALLQRYPQTQILVCDDGLQHYGLFRDLEICVFDDRGCGNGWLLPSGPLREYWPRALVAAAGQTSAKSLALHTGQSPAFPGLRGHRSLADFGIRRNGELVSLADLAAPVSQPLIALAGTSQPEEFFTMLRAQGLVLQETLALPDHYDFDSWPRTRHAGHSLICTEKDAAKLWRVAPDAIAVPLHFELEPAFWNQFDPLLRAASAAKLSSPHGHTTT